MAATYEKIATSTISGSSTTSISFINIPATYTDLVAVFNGGGSNPANVQTQVNSDTGSNYSTLSIYAVSGSVASPAYANNTVMYTAGVAGSLPTTISAMAIMQFMNYANTTTYKTVLSRYSAAAIETTTNVSLWRNTAAISTIRFFSYSQAFLAGSTFTLYGILKA